MYTGTETELSHSIHLQGYKECSAISNSQIPLSHELIPIATMAEHSSSPLLMPEMLDSLPQPMQLMNPSSIGSGGCMVSSILTGVYTLQEQTEHEADENTSM